MFILLAAAVMSAPAFAQVKLTADNIDEVLAAMTLEEKAKLVVGPGWGGVPAGVPESKCILPGAAGTTQAIERLGIPQTVLSDGPAGLRIHDHREGSDRTYYCTGFPVGTSLASSWDLPLVEEVTKAMGNEVLEYGSDVLLAPGQNIHRNPLCGRNFEYFSEDPLLSGKMAAAYVRGIQSNGVGTSVKHFAANNQENNRYENDARISERALREIYLRNFEISVKESEPWTIMSSYNRLNGPYTQASHYLLTEVLREQWGYKGMVMSDWTGTRVTSDQIMAGNDLLQPGFLDQEAELVRKVRSGEMPVEALDVCVRRVLEYIVKTPRFKGYKFSENPDLTAHAAVARKAAGETMVLLKNEEKTLPMAKGAKVALFGASAVNFIAGGTGSGEVHKAYVTNMVDGLEHAGYQLDGELKKFYRTCVDYGMAEAALDGRYWNVVVPDPAVSKKYVQKTVSRNDIAVVVIGRNSGEGGDRWLNDFYLTEAERNLIKDVCNVYHQEKKKVVVVLNIGGVIETASWKEMPDAILLAWQPGQEGGDAVADVLSGDVNPSAKLPMTFPNDYMHHWSSLNFPYEANWHGKNRKDIDYTNYEEGIYVGYRYFGTYGKAVSYPFGFGLSYTTFSYSKPVVKLSSDGSLRASVVVTNTGDVAGREVVQLYVSAPAGGLDKPESELKSFAKTKTLAPGESQTLTFSVDAYTLASFDEAADMWKTAAGTYEARFSAAYGDVRAKSVFKMSKSYRFVK